MTNKLFPDDISEEDDTSLLEGEVVKLIEKALKERIIDLAIDDVKIIARELMPDLDKMIAFKVKNHFYEMGSFLVKKFGDMEEGE